MKKETYMECSAEQLTNVSIKISRAKVRKTFLAESARILATILSFLSFYHDVNSFFLTCSVANRPLDILIAWLNPLAWLNPPPHSIHILKHCFFTDTQMAKNHFSHWVWMFAQLFKEFNVTKKDLSVLQISNRFPL